jgi:hypothetical protein
VAVRKSRTMVLLWARQCRKSTALAVIAFDELSRGPHRSVIAASASLLVGSELVGKSVSTVERAAVVVREAAAFQAGLVASLGACEAALRLVAADRQSSFEYRSLGGDEFTDLYRAGRLELRLYHDRSAYSRLQIIAPNPATARGWTGTVLRDEAAFTPAGLEAELQEAVEPIMDADPSFRLVSASNLPADDGHPFFLLTMPPAELDFVPSPRGSFYRGQNGILIHRVALADAYLAGHVLYDHHTAAPLTLEQFYAQAVNKGALRRNYQLIHEFGGAAAIDLLALCAAQRRGLAESLLITIDSQADLDRAVAFLGDHLRDGPVGVGLDVATTTRSSSHPSSLTVTEKRGHDHVQVLVALWKERQPQIARERLRQVLEAIGGRGSGGRARRLCIDASNERYFAQETADLFAPLLPTELVVNSSAVQPPVCDLPTNMKTHLGDLYCACFNDNHYTAPADDYYKTDHRLVVKDQGAYLCQPGPEGMHGDTFDSGKLAHWALTSASGAILDAAGIRIGGGRLPPPRQLPLPVRCRM